jgi:hypothetical protein
MPPSAFAPEHLAALRQAHRLVRAGALEAAEAMLAPVLPAAREGERLVRDPAPLVRHVAEATRVQAWRVAQAACDILISAGHPGMKGRGRWLAARAKDEDAFRAQFLDRPALERIGPALSDRLGAPVLAIETTAMPPGEVALALYRHEVTLAGAGRPLSIVEKVYGDRDRDAAKVALQALLFGAMPPAALLAPDWHGTLRDGRFASVLKGFAGRHPLPGARWQAAHAALMLHYWSLAPSAALLAAAPPAVQLRHALQDWVAHVALGQVPQGLRDAMGAEALGRVARTLSRRLPRLREVLDWLPLFVFHGDLHAGNMLLDEAGRLRVIDWDTWALAPVGVGWHVPDDPGQAPLPIDMAALRAARPRENWQGEAELAIAALAYGSMKAVRRKRWATVARRLDLLAELAGG